MTKKVAVIGKGTAGCMSAAYWSWTAARHNTHDWRNEIASSYSWDRDTSNNLEVDWYFDPNIKTQAVGEGSNLVLPVRLNDTVNFSPREFSLVDASLKTGIYKQNWGKGCEPFLHDFASPAVSIHFNAIKLQEYIETRIPSIYPRTTIKRMNVDASNIDADFVLDASGKPDSYEDFAMSPYIPVNSVYVTQCYWDFPRFNYTLTIARPYGWVFGIPLQNRCSIGYMYNKDINTLEEVQEDVKHIFEQYNLTPSMDTNAFSFKNYKRLEQFRGNTVYNGNASFFLEPLEATSFGNADAINNQAYSYWFNGTDKREMEKHYQSLIDSTEQIIMIHYWAGSDFTTDFWEYAEERGRKCIENASPSFHAIINNRNSDRTPELDALLYNWSVRSWEQNIIGLGLGGT